MLNDAVEGLKADLRDLEGRLDATQAAALAGEGVASQSQLQVRGGGVGGGGCACLPAA